MNSSMRSRINEVFLRLLASFLIVFLAGSFKCIFAEEEIDPSDPTKIYSSAGGGLKYNDYANDEHMIEMRATGNLTLSERDLTLFELGYGWHSGDKVEGDNSGLTNARLRWFHLFDMDSSVMTGFRGWATQVDFQIPGALKGTDGQGTVSFGALPAFGISEKWSAFIAINVVNSWDKDFENYNGYGISLAPLLVYTPDYLWEGAYVQIWPSYTYFLGGELKDEGSGSFDITTGGPITDKIMWAVMIQKNFDVDLRTFRRGEDAGHANDWNAFFNITTYF
jgi:hypothetical protein